VVFCLSNDGGLIISPSLDKAAHSNRWQQSVKSNPLKPTPQNCGRSASMTQAEQVLARLSTPYVITLYIGGNMCLSDDPVVHARDEAFCDVLEEELERLGVRSLDNEIGWDVSQMPDVELADLEQYLEDLWDDVRDGMLKTIKEGWEKKRHVGAAKEAE
jgi:hypothetical protein